MRRGAGFIIGAYPRKTPGNTKKEEASPNLSSCFLVSCVDELLSIHSVIDVGEQVVAAFNLAEPAFVEVRPLELIVQVQEIEHMDARALAGVVHHRASLH